MAWYMTFSQNPILGFCDMYQILWYVSDFVICIRFCDMYQILWYVSDFVICIRFRDMYQISWYVSDFVICIRFCDMYQILWYVSDFFRKWVGIKRTNVNLAVHMPQAINTTYNLKWNLRPQTRGSILCFLFKSRLVNLMKLLKPEEYVWRYVGMVT